MSPPPSTTVSWLGGVGEWHSEQWQNGSPATAGVQQVDVCGGGTLSHVVVQQDAYVSAPYVRVCAADTLLTVAAGQYMCIGGAHCR